MLADLQQVVTRVLERSHLGEDVVRRCFAILTFKELVEPLIDLVSGKLGLFDCRLFYSFLLPRFKNVFVCRLVNKFKPYMIAAKVEHKGKIREGHE